MPMGEAGGGMCDCLRVDSSGGGVRAHVWFLVAGVMPALLVQKWDVIVGCVGWSR